MIIKSHTKFNIMFYIKDLETKTHRFLRFETLFYNFTKIIGMIKMMFLLFLFNFLSMKDKNLEYLYNEKDFASYLGYCKSHYKRIPQDKNMKLQKLVVFHRHGDRAPQATLGTEWANESCKKCKYKNNKISNCKTVKCSNGLLTLKGYNQMIDLGKYINENYTELTEKKIKTRCTAIERTQTSLHGVYYGLTKSDTVPDVKIKDLKVDPLIIPSDCPLIDERIDSNIYSPFLPLKDEDNKLGAVPPKTRADQYFTAICNKVQIDCDEINCDYSIIKKYLENSNESWSQEASTLLRDELILRMTFGRFVKDLKNILDDQANLHIISVHDRSLVVVMTGLGIDETQHPAYGSAIFMEEWKNKDGEEFIKILYNDKTCKTVIDDQCNIPKKKFIEYINVLEMDEEEMREQCNIQNFTKNEFKK